MARTLLKSLVDARYLRDITLFNRAYDLAVCCRWRRQFLTHR
ncbi:MAG TPA: hypothetical protein VFX70_10085 [Mycobacteriales bacterium]|nr:hypothetical protein [Mycobacteriales bacterium]